MSQMSPVYINSTLTVQPDILAFVRSFLDKYLDLKLIFSAYLLAAPQINSDNSSFDTATTSPRISFCHNLDDSLTESYPCQSNHKSDFDFCFTVDPIQNEVSSADKLFCNGLIR